MTRTVVRAAPHPGRATRQRRSSLRRRAVIAREFAWGVRFCWATIRRDGLKVSRKRVWALMHANGLYLVRDHEPGETPRGHVAVPKLNRGAVTDMTTCWTRKDGIVAIVPTTAAAAPSSSS